MTDVEDMSDSDTPEREHGEDKPYRAASSSFCVYLKEIYFNKCSSLTTSPPVIDHVSSTPIPRLQHDVQIPRTRKKMFRDARKNSIIEHAELLNASWKGTLKRFYEGYVFILNVPEDTPFALLEALPKKEVTEEVLKGKNYEIVFPCGKQFRVKSKRTISQRSIKNKPYKLSRIYAEVENMPVEEKMETVAPTQETPA